MRIDFKKKQILILIFLFASIFLVEAKDQIISVDYSFSDNASFEKIIEFSSVLLKVSTDMNAICRYSESQGVSYVDMEGRFEPTLGRFHEKIFSNLEDKGIYEYYVKCINKSSDINSVKEPSELEIRLHIDLPVSAQLIFPEEKELLRAGKIELTLKTSEIVLQTPSLSYSFDGIVYNEIPLFPTGSEKIWKGYISIPKDLGESPISFKFSAIDLKGRVGEEITNKGVYFVDTIKPKTIANINAVGYEGKIKLEWYMDEEVEEFNIYRSTEPNLDYTNFYKTTNENPFYDYSVEKGKTYYYRITAVDKAGNEADLSKEVYATALLENNTSSSSLGLDLGLRGYVDNFLMEVDSVITEIGDVKKSISSKQEEERVLFSDLKLEKEIDNAKSELEALKRDVEKYKHQDLTKNELNKKLDSARLKLNIIKRKVPENLVILGEESESSEISKEDVEEAILELKGDISEKEKEKSVEETLKIIESSGLKIESTFYIAEIIHLDGTKKEISVIKRDIIAELERKENRFFIEIIAKDIAESASELDIKNLDYNIVKEDPVLSFGSDTKKIIYLFNRKLSLSSLKEIKLVFVNIVEQEEELESGITGYFFLADKLGKKSYIGIFVGVIFFAVLLVYLSYLRKNKYSELFLGVSRQTKNISDFLGTGHLEKAKEAYNSIKKDYNNLSEKEKKRVYRKLEFLRSEIMKKELEGQNKET